MPTRLPRIALAFVLLFSTRVVTQSPPALFVSPAAGQAVAAMDAAPSAAVADRRAVGMRLDALFDAGFAQPRVLLNVDGRDWIARLERMDGDALGFRSWVGQIEGVQHSHVVFTERDGTVSGLINTVDETYRLRTVAAGSYLLERMSADTSRGDSEPRTAPVAVRQASADAIEAAADTAATIDVLMLYTPNARARIGGDSQIQATAAQIISDSNTIFGRSNIATRMRLVGAVEFSLVEALTMGSDLNAVTDSPIARAMRDSYRADLVQLLVSSPDLSICGLGWLLTTLTSTNFDAYSVVDVDCVPQYSPTHEMGHNMGSHHAPEDGAFGALFSYSYGYKDPGLAFRTLMASACATGTCPRIANFSNPGIFNNGFTTGSSTQNNSLSINNAALTVANFRQSASGGGTGGPGGGTGGTPVPWVVSVTQFTNTVSATWPSPTNGFIASSYQVEINNAATAAPVAIVNVGTAQFYSTSLPNGSYVLRVRALGAGGTSTLTNDVSFLVGLPSTTTPPFAPQDLRAELSGGRVNLTWNVSAGTPAVAAFIIDVGTAPTHSNLGSFDTGNNALQLSAPQPVPGVYFVRVRARNVFGSSPPSNEIILHVPGGSTPVCAGPPATPTGLTSTVSGLFVTLSWVYPLATSPATGYVLDVGSSPGLTNLLQLPLGAATVFGGVASPGTYFARVRATNSCGISGPSNEVMVVVQ